MHRFAAFLNTLSLRHRFLVVPLLGLVLLGLLTAAFVVESQRQNGLLDRIAERDFAAFDRYSTVFIHVSQQHMALYNLLYGASKFDEEALYDQAKQRLHGIHQAIRDIELALPAGTVERDAHSVALRGTLLAHTQRYAKAVTSAVEMATVNLALAPGQLARANEYFTTMNFAFNNLLDAERGVIKSEIAARVHYSDMSSTLIALGSMAAAGLLLALAFALSRLLSRSLQTQINDLTVLAAEAGARITDDSDSGNEVGRIAQAIAVFRQSLLQLQTNEQALGAMNRSLQQENQERKEAERSLRIYAEVIRSTGDAVVITNLNGKIIEVNPAYEHSVNRSREEVIGTHLYGSSPDYRLNGLYQELWRSLESDAHWSGEILDRRSNGESFPSWVLINAVPDEHGNPMHYACVSRDITALKQSEQQLKKLAFYDTLTELPNRALFNDRLTVALAHAQRQQTRLAVLYLDLDHFKYVNDTLGHPVGDQLLIEVGHRIGRCLRATDTLARMGGDEFTIILSPLGAEDEALWTTERITEAVGKPFQLGHEVVYVGVSVGISLYPKDGSDAETLQKNADIAMYEAKEAGRGQCRIFSPEMSTRSNEYLSLSVQIDAALKNEEFSLFYQPIVNPATGVTESVEALIRWQKPGGELISPAQFIPHAEAAGLINKIDSWVLERACRDAMNWRQDDGRELRVGVNLSAVSVQQPNMAKLISDILQRTKLPPHLLNLEITETAVIANPYAAQKVLEEIAALGIGLSLDDFGTGFSSLSYLTRFPINCIKLDRMFVERIGKDKATEEVIQSLLDLSRKLKLHVVAEGIEEQYQQTFLTAAGCELMQGFHFARPMPNDQLLSWLSSSQALPVTDC